MKVQEAVLLNRNSDINPRNYLENLLKNGNVEQEINSEMNFPPWYDSKLFKRLVFFFTNNMKVFIIYFIEKL